MSRLLALSLALLLAACAASHKSAKKPSSTDGEYDWAAEKADSDSSSDDEEPAMRDPKKEQLPVGPNCLDTKGDVQECLNDPDCCKGFYCGIDPSGSSRIKVCLYGGQ